MQSDIHGVGVVHEASAYNVRLDEETESRGGLNAAETGRVWRPLSGRSFHYSTTLCRDDESCWLSIEMIYKDHMEMERCTPWLA